MNKILVLTISLLALSFSQVHASNWKIDAVHSGFFFDVQHILQEASPEEVRAEVRFLIEAFDRPDGGMCIAAGNGIVAGTPIENIAAFLDEAVKYGSEHRTSQA